MPEAPASPGPVLVRCDVGPDVGMGHVMRTLALAEEFAERGHEVVYAADLDSVPFAAGQVRDRGFGQVAAPHPADVAAHERLLAAIVPEVAVVDSYRVTKEVYAAMRARVPTVALVDGDPAGRVADLLLDVNIEAEHDVWPMAPGTRRLAGLDYALIRSDILALRPADPHRDEADPLRLLAFFGGTDAMGAAPVVVGMLASTGVRCDLTVVAAGADRHAELAAIELAPGQHLEVIEPTSRIAGLVRDADLVLSAAGSSSWELLCLATACALVCVADNQETSYRRVADSGTVLGLGLLSGLRTDPRPAAAELAGLLADAGARERLRAAGWGRVDGAGRRRVADAVAELVRARSLRAR